MDQCFLTASPQTELVNGKLLLVLKTFITEGLVFLKTVGKKWF
jgi:hypothetical protein